MTEYKAYIERSWIMDSWRIYVTGRFSDRREYVTLKDGKVISTIIDECQMIPDGGHFLELPDSVFKAIKDRIMSDVEQQGGAPTQQSLRGEIKRLENEVNWLREKYSAL
jgi:hypothetical protein